MNDVICHRGYDIDQLLDVRFDGAVFARQLVELNRGVYRLGDRLVDVEGELRQRLPLFLGELCDEPRDVLQLRTADGRGGGGQSAVDQIVQVLFQCLGVAMPRRRGGNLRLCILA